MFRHKPETLRAELAQQLIVTCPAPLAAGAEKAEAVAVYQPVERRVL